MADDFSDAVADDASFDSGDLRREIEALKADRSSLEAKLASTESDLKAVAGQASHLEGELRVALDDLSTANIAASDAEKDAAELRLVIKNLESAKADLEVKVAGLESKVLVLEQERRFAEENAKASVDAKEKELSAVLKDLEGDKAREKELLALVKDLEVKNGELKAKNAELVGEIGRLKSNGEKSRDINGSDGPIPTVVEGLSSQTTIIATVVTGIALVAAGVGLHLSRR